MPLFILKQTSLSEDTVVDGGVSKVIHTVVKNSPFAILVGQGPEGAAGPITTPFINFNDYTVNCVLIYDTSENKPVDFIKNEPICFKPTVHNDGATLHIEAKLKVLTSKHEDMNFKVLIKLLPLNPIITAPLEIASRPIKVISKPEQIKKRRKGSADSDDWLAPAQKNPRVKMNILPDGLILPQIQQTIKAPEPVQQQQQPSLTDKVSPSVSAPIIKPILNKSQGQTDYPAGYNIQQQQQQQHHLQPVSQTYSSLEDLTSSYAITRSLDNNIIESLQRIESKETSYLGFIEEVCSFVYNIVGGSNSFQLQQQQQQQQPQSREEVPLASEVGAANSLISMAATSPTGNGMPNSEQNPYYQGNANYYESDRTVSCLLDSFGRLSQVERANQVRRVMNVLSAEQKSNMSEMIELFFNEGLENTRNERLRLPTFSSSSSSSSSVNMGMNSNNGGNPDDYFQQHPQGYFSDPSDLSSIWF